MPVFPDLETRIRRAVDDVLVQAAGTFLDVDEDQFTALSYVTTSAVMAEVNRKLPEMAAPDSGGHTYLSTGCHHGHESFAHGLTGHEYCRSRNGVLGDKKPAQCKGETCNAACICMCHVAARDLDPADKDALRAWMAVRRDPGKTYPATIAEFTAIQHERLRASLPKDTEDDQPDPPTDQ